MIAELPPGLILILGGLALVALRPAARAYGAILIALLAVVQVLTLPMGTAEQAQLFDFSLVLLRVDGLAVVFGAIFAIAALVNAVYGFSERDGLQQSSSLIYAGAALGAVFAGDLISLFVFWELTAIASVFLIWASRTDRAVRAGMRYLVVQIGSGVILFTGVLLHYRATGSVTFDKMVLGDLPSILIFLAFGVKCAFPLLHNWLPDAYPKATIFGSVVLSAFTTKLAVYALARGFPGTEILIWIGAAMTIYGSAYAMVEDHARKLLSYSLMAQLGFLVVGAGIGTPLAIAGVAGHAASSVFYQALLFMCVGVAIQATGKERLSELGGLARRMPWTTVFCCIGALTISSMPLTAAFLSKSLILSAAAKESFQAVWLLLLAGAAATVVHTAIRIPHGVFFGADKGLGAREAPLSSRVAMAVIAVGLVAIGVMPDAFYALLPGTVSYDAYTLGHVVTQLQLILFAALAYALMIHHDIYPVQGHAINLDSDWFYRRFLPDIYVGIRAGVSHIHFRALTRAQKRLARFIAAVYRHHGPQGALARTWPVGSTVLWVAVLLCVTLVFFYVE
jgi:multicomponent Na+:H+ antiporter subunit D